MDRHKIAATSLQCPVCKRRVQIWRKASKLRKIGHIKHMWCPYCRKKSVLSKLIVRWVIMDGFLLMEK